MNRILKPNAEGAGTRIYPARTARNDEKFGIRIDKGEAVNGEPNIRRIKLQINSNTADTALAKIVAKNPHGVISHADVDVEKDATEEALIEVFTQFADNRVV